MNNVVRLPRKVRPLRATYQPDAPYAVTREDQDDGSISFFVFDERPDSYRFVCGTSDDCGTNPYAKFYAEQIARGLNLLVQYGMEQLPSVRRDHDED